MTHEPLVKTRKPAITDPTVIRRLIAEHGRWWHEIEVAPGIVTPGDDSNRMKLPILDRLGLALDLSGRRALDIGCSDGFFSFELERRGADVVAIDFVPETYTGFSTARRILGRKSPTEWTTSTTSRPNRMVLSMLCCFWAFSIT